MSTAVIINESIHILLPELSFWGDRNALRAITRKNRAKSDNCDHSSFWVNRGFIFPITTIISKRQTSLVSPARNPNFTRKLMASKTDSGNQISRKFGYDVTLRTSFVRTDSSEGGGASQCQLRFQVLSINTFHILLEVALTSKLCSIGASQHS